MERIYFLLTGEGPEKDAVESFRKKCADVWASWVAFREKYGNENSRTFADRFCRGISFTDQMCSIKEAREQAPEGWKSIASNSTAFRPLKTKCPEAYKDWKSLPVQPCNTVIGESLGAKDVYKGNRMLFLSYEVNGAGDIILTCPIEKDGTYYEPKGECEELTTSRYIELNI